VVVDVVEVHVHVHDHVVADATTDRFST